MLWNYSATKLNALFLSGQVSATEIITAFLQRIKEFDPHIGAFITVFEEKALNEAAKQDQRRASGEKLGRLAGVPVAIKDNIHVFEEITTCGSNFLSNYKAPFEASAVTALRNEDAIFIGKTNLDEFAMGSSTENSAIQLTRNPWNVECTPGGSSGGSGAAVAARMCPIALGSDTGGSVRLPGAFCGVFGYKPTYGRVSRYGLVAYGSSLDQIGPITHSIDDLKLTMQIIGNPCEMDSTSIQSDQEDYSVCSRQDFKGLKFGYPSNFLKDMNQEAKKHFDEICSEVEKLGGILVPVDLDILKYSIATYYILATAEASTNLARFDGIRYGKRSKKASSLEDVYRLSKQEGFGSEVKRRILLGTYVLSAGYNDAYYKKAQKVRTLIIESHKKAFEHCDAVIMPTAPFTAFKLGSIQDPLQMYLTDIYTLSANLAGVPTINVPSGFSSEGMPWGIQICGPQLHDKQVLDFAQILDRQLNQSCCCPELDKTTTKTRA